MAEVRNTSPSIVTVDIGEVSRRGWENQSGCWSPSQDYLGWKSWIGPRLDEIKQRNWINTGKINVLSETVRIYKALKTQTNLRWQIVFFVFSLKISLKKNFTTGKISIIDFIILKVNLYKTFLFVE